MGPRSNRRSGRIVAFLVCLNAATAPAGEIVIQAPAGTRPATAVATSVKGSQETTGWVKGDTVRFKEMPAETPVDITLTLVDGAVLQGVDMSWYSREPGKPDAGEITDDDRQQISAVLKEVLSFYNRSDLILLQGNHDRAVALVQLVRDKPFHSDKGGEVICHIELWYLKNQHGGWEKTQQANKIVRRERFESPQAYHDAVDHLRWTPQLGGLKLARDQAELTIKLPANAGSAVPSSTSPASGEK